MNPEPENFDSLIKLMALKRYEQPPPGYFDRLSEEVTSHILAEPGGGAPAAELVPVGAGWLRRIWAMFHAQPILAGAFGVGVCAAMLSGIIYSQKLEQSVQPQQTAEQLLPPGSGEVWAWNRPASARVVLGSNSVIEPQIPAALFDASALGMLPKVSTLPANFVRPPSN